MSVIEGNLSAKSFRFAIVVSRYNDYVTKRLLNGALDCLTKHGASKKMTDVFYCPGAFEIPLVAQRVATTGKYNAIICLGSIVRGETPHFEYIAQAASTGVNRAALETNVPMSFGILTTDSLEQAIERAGGKGGNKGSEAALAAIELADLYKKITTKKKK